MCARSPTSQHVQLSRELPSQERDTESGPRAHMTEGHNSAHTNDQWRKDAITRACDKSSGCGAICMFLIMLSSTSVLDRGRLIHGANQDVVFAFRSSDIREEGGGKNKIKRKEKGYIYSIVAYMTSICKPS